MSANDKQVAGDHYRAKTQHWDWVHQNDLDYFQGNITKYIVRWKKKGGLEDLYKAQHYLAKYIELQQPPDKFEARPSGHYIGLKDTGDGDPTSAYVGQGAVSAEEQETLYGGVLRKS